MRDSLRQLYGSAVRDVPSIVRLLAENPARDDVVVVAGHSSYPRLIEVKLGFSLSFLAFYDPALQDIKPFTRFGHAVYLPIDASLQDIAAAMELVMAISSALGTIEDEIIGISPQMTRLREQISNMISKKNIPVHLEGETGTGKSVIAQLIHDGRFKKKKKLIKDVASFYRGSLCENRMFGNKRGAYTGADNPRIGIFAMADGSEFFMDELQDFPIESQSMMLDVLENGLYRSQGEDFLKKTSFVFMTASNVPIKTLLAENKLRPDLWYRMNSYVISISPLREHPEDIPLLIAHWEFMHEVDVEKSLKDNKSLQRREWRGNVRELFRSLEKIHMGLEDTEGNQL